MSNSDNETVTGRCDNFVNRLILNLNKADKAINLEALKVTCGGTFLRESESIKV